MHTRTALFALSLLGAALATVGEPVRYGNGVTIEAVTPIADLLANPSEFLDREVRVEGQVSGVCKMQGCWMELADSTDHRLRVKVEDGVIVFPTEAHGKWAAAQGTVTLKELSREQYVAFQQHLAEETGGKFDPAAIGEGPFQLVQIAGSGAEIGAR